MLDDDYSGNMQSSLIIVELLDNYDFHFKFMQFILTV